MPIDRVSLYGAEPPEDQEGFCTEEMPEVPTEAIRQDVHLDDAEERTKKRAKVTFRAFRPSRGRIARATKRSKRAKRFITTLEETLKRDWDRWDRLKTVMPRRQTSPREVFSFNNIWSLAGLVGCGSLSATLFGGEVLSATLQMQNSNWGLTEGIILMVVLMLCWVVQPFLASKFLCAVMPSKIARVIDMSIAAIGIPFALFGFWVVASTLGPLAEAPEFDMTATAVPEKPETTSTTVYFYSGMVSMWLGSYTAFYFFQYFLDQLWPVSADDRADYTMLTARINEGENDISDLEDVVTDSEQELEAERYLEDRYIEECLACLRKAQAELRDLRNAVRLQPFQATPSPN